MGADVNGCPPHVATATVFAVTAGSGDGYRIKRVYLDGEQGLRVRPGLQRHCVEVVGLSRRRWRRCFWDTITQVRADLAGSPGNDLRYFVRRVE